MKLKRAAAMLEVRGYIVKSRVVGRRLIPGQNQRRRIGRRSSHICQWIVIVTTDFPVRLRKVCSVEMICGVKVAVQGRFADAR